jgi:pimeloyl-ACP methyl ester carboxylesterase
MPTAVAQAARVRRLYAQGRFGQTHVRIARPDPNPPGLPKRRPLICFHMSPLSGQMFETWLAEMGRDRIAIAVDSPGFGYSDTPSTSPSMSDYAGAMGDVLDSPGLSDLDLSELDVLGYHTGGRIAVQLTLQRPKTVRHIVLVGAGMYSQAQQKKHYAAFKQAPVHDDGSHLLNLWRSMMRWRGPHRSLEDLMASYPDMLRGGENQHLIYKANTEFSLVEHLKELYQPILVLNPRDDLWEYTPLIESHLKPSDRLVNLPGCGIGFLDYHTKATAEMVRDFVDG